MTSSSQFQRVLGDLRPPLDVLDQLRMALVLIDEVGTPYSDAGRQQRLEDGLFSGTRRRSIAEGTALRWIKGARACRDAILDKIPVNETTALEVWTGLQSLSRQCAELPVARTSQMPLSEGERLENGLVQIASVRRIGYLSGHPSVHSYASVPGDWAGLFVSLEAMELQVRDILLRCLGEGRVICVQDEVGGPQLILPGHWSSTSRVREPPASYFLLTSELPESWHFAGTADHVVEHRRQKAAAKRWLYNEYLRLAPLGERILRDDAKSMIAKRFGIRSDQVFREIWKETPISEWHKPGRPKNT